jgi:uncharacterized membrane protein YoaK (UPF0700 family)
MQAPPDRRTTVLGLEVWEAGFLPLAVGAIAHFARDGVHGAWAVISIVAVAGYLAGTLAEVVGRRRNPRPPGRQDWFATVLMLAAAALFATPDDPPEHAVWPWLVLALVAGSATAVAAREIRRRRARPSSD